ncbi:T1SS secreted agglutinin RTX [Vibrio ponticus]|nr:T1SS secreted agglutinin RTX [Vibrio ponticus]
MTAKSADDADVQATIDVTIKDGVETTLTYSSVEYTELKTGTGLEESYGYRADSVAIKAGVDGVSKVEVLLDEPSVVNSWTSQGKELEVVSDGNDFKLVDKNDADSVVLEFVFDDDTGDYSIEQFLPLDQVNGEQSIINLTVKAYSTDDELTSANIAITINDGLETSLSDRVVNLNETDDANNNFNQTETTGNVNLKPGVDGVSAIALTLSQTQIDDINDNWSSQGKPLSVVEDLDNNSYALVYKADPDTQVLTVTLDSQGHYKVEQLLPIDQQGSTSSLVFAVTASSTDDADITKNLTVNVSDGVDTSLQDDVVTLQETVDSDGEFATKSISGDVNLNPGPDGAKSSISLANADEIDSWTSNGKQTSVATTANTVTVLDEDNNKVLELIYYQKP